VPVRGTGVSGTIIYTPGTFPQTCVDSGLATRFCFAVSNIRTIGGKRTIRTLTVRKNNGLERLIACRKYKKITGFVPTGINVKKVVKNGPNRSE
jgi:hypothetical protein